MVRPWEKWDISGDQAPLPIRNAEKILGYLNTNVLSHDLIPPHVNFSHLTAKDYNEMYRVIMTVKEAHFKELGLDPCLLEDELNKVPEVTFPIGSPWWELLHLCHSWPMD